MVAHKVISLGYPLVHLIATLLAPHYATCRSAISTNSRNQLGDPREDAGDCVLTDTSARRYLYCHAYWVTSQGNITYLEISSCIPYMDIYSQATLCNTIFKGKPLCRIRYYIEQLPEPPRVIDTNLNIEQCGRDKSVPLTSHFIIKGSRFKFLIDPIRFIELANNHVILRVQIEDTPLDYHGIIKTLRLNFVAAKIIAIFSNPNIAKIERNSFNSKLFTDLIHLRFIGNSFNEVATESLQLGKDVESLHIENLKPVSIGKYGIEFYDMSCRGMNLSIRLKAHLSSYNLGDDFIKFSNGTCARDDRPGIINPTYKLDLRGNNFQGEYLENVFKNLFSYPTHRYFIQSTIYLDGVECCKSTNRWIFNLNQAVKQTFDAKCTDIDTSLANLTVSEWKILCDVHKKEISRAFNRMLIYALIGVVLVIFLGLAICLCCLGSDKSASILSVRTTSGPRKVWSKGHSKTRRSKLEKPRQTGFIKLKSPQANQHDKILQNEARLKSLPSTNPSEVAFLAPRGSDASSNVARYESGKRKKKVKSKYGSLTKSKHGSKSKSPTGSK